MHNDWLSFDSHNKKEESIYRPKYKFSCVIVKDGTLSWPVTVVASYYAHLVTYGTALYNACKLTPNATTPKTFTYYNTTSYHLYPVFYLVKLQNHPFTFKTYLWKWPQNRSRIQQILELIMNRLESVKIEFSVPTTTQLNFSTVPTNKQTS